MHMMMSMLSDFMLSILLSPDLLTSPSRDPSLQWTCLFPTLITEEKTCNSFESSYIYLHYLQRYLIRDFG